MSNTRRKPAPLTAMSLKRLRDEGAYADKVEQVIPQRHWKKDLFGIFDVLAIAKRHGLSQIIGIQISRRHHMAERRDKILNSPEAVAWHNACGLIELWGWDQPKGPGTRWRLKIETIDLLADLIEGTE